MRPLIFVLCAVLLAGAGEVLAASYRFQVLIDLDRDAATGCASDGATPAISGQDLRVVALSDRAQISETVVEGCHQGAWEVLDRDAAPRAIAVGQGQSGSDAIEWSLSRQWLAGASRIPLQFLAERLDSPATDVLGEGVPGTPLELELGAGALAVPTIGSGGLALLAVALAWLGWRRSRRTGAATVSAGLLILAVLGQGALPDARAQADGIHRAAASDAGNDAADAGADILHVQAAADDERVQFRVDVNDIENAGLADGASVLFIGNSLTYSNELPWMLEAIALQAGKHLRTDAITIPGGALEDHFRQRTAHPALASGGYSVVILQQGPSSLPENQENLREWTARFESRIRAGGARPALYMVWPDATRLAYFDAVHASYSNAALAVNGMFIPAGEAWRAAWRVDPQLPLYDGDQFHPSALGSYTAALSMFAELYRQSPVGLPANLMLANGDVLQFDAGQAQIVQTAAWSAHLEFGRAGE